MKRLMLIGFALALVAGCGTSSSQPQLGGELRYTVRDVMGERSGRKRDSVLKTIGMTLEQIRAWGKESAAGEDRFVPEEGAGGPGAAVITCRNERGSVSSRDAGVTEVLRKSNDEILAWATDAKGAKEGRSATFYRNGHVEIVWHGSAGQLLYTVRDEKGSRTSRDRESAFSALTMSEQQVRQWAEDAAASAEGRCATFMMNGYVEGISHGVLEDPPWQP
ncbi:MAG: hypothetical protein ACJ8F7_22435 [Gemmataceae bacterium]